MIEINNTFNEIEMYEINKIKHLLNNIKNTKYKQTNKRIKLKYKKLPMWLNYEIKKAVLKNGYKLNTFSNIDVYFTGFDKVEHFNFHKINIEIDIFNKDKSIFIYHNLSIR